MRRLSTTLLVTCLAAMGASAAMAQQPSPNPETTGQFVEVPEAGIALTLPGDWEVVARMQETDVGGHMDDPDRSLWLVLDSRTPHRYPDAETGGCNVWLFQTTDPDPGSITLDDIWSDPYVYWSDPRYEATRATTEVMLPAGPATRFDFGDPFMYGDRYHADYRLVAPDGIAWLMCKSLGARPDDDWMSIAETFEFLPADKSVQVPPSASSGSAIAKSFPASVGGRPVEVTTWSGPQWLTRYDPEGPDEGIALAIEATEALVTAAGTTLDELTIATAVLEPSYGKGANITAVHIPGSRAFDLIDPVIDLMAGATEPRVGWDRVSDRWVALVVDEAAPDTGAGRHPETYPLALYPAGDIVWVIQVEHGPLVEVIVADLPPQPTLVGPVEPLTQRIDVPDLGIAVSLPKGWAIETLPETPGSAIADRFIERYGLGDASIVRVFHAEGPGNPRRSAPDQCDLSLFGPDSSAHMSPRVDAQGRQQVSRSRSCWVAAITLRTCGAGRWTRSETYRGPLPRPLSSCPRQSRAAKVHV